MDKLVNEIQSEINKFSKELGNINESDDISNKTDIEKYITGRINGLQIALDIVNKHKESRFNYSDIM